MYSLILRLCYLKRYLWFDCTCMVLKLFISVFEITFITSFYLKHSSIDTEEIIILILEMRELGEVISDQRKSVLQKLLAGIFLCSIPFM